MRLISYKRYKQEEEKDCGVAALSMIISYFNGNYPYEYLKDLTNLNSRGTSIYNLVEAAKMIDLNPVAVEGSFDNIKKENYPFIAHVKNKNYHHFITIFKRSAHNLIIGDPASDKKEMSIEEFRDLSSGYYIFFRPVKRIKKFKTSNYILDEIKTFIYDYKISFLTTIFISILFNILLIFSAYKNESFIRYAVNYSSQNNLYKLSVFYLLLYLLIFTINYLRKIKINYLVNKLNEILNNILYEKIINLPYLYHKDRSSTDIMVRINDIEIIKKFLNNLIFLTSDIFVMLISFIFVYKLSKISLYITFIFIILIFLLYLIYIPIIEYFLENGKNLESSYKNNLYETVNSYESLLSFNNINNYKYHNYKLNRKLNYLKYLFSKYEISLEFIIDFLIKTFEIIIYIISISLIINNRLSLTRFITLLTILEFIYKPVLSGFLSVIEYKDIKLSISRINNLFNVKNEEKGGLIIKKDNIDIEYKDFNFSFNKEILKNVNLKIKQGEKIFFNGVSGSGKSTIFKALVKLYESESIYLNGFKIRDINTDSLRDNILYVPQDNLIFNDTILNNICLGKSILNEDIRKIMTITLFDKVLINKNIYLEEKLNESGFGLSGGERQKLVLTRALLKSPKVLILDESLSGISEEESKDILKNIIKNYKNMTLILISHNNSYARLFKKKYRLEKGLLIDEN